jgi:hypothetical protein
VKRAVGGPEQRLLAIDDVAQAEIIGLRGARYRVSTAPTELRVDTEDVLRINGEIDRVYVNAPPRVTLRDSGYELHVDSTNFPDVVIWNPGAAKAAALTDLSPGGEREMVCIEAGAIQEPVVVAPGQTWSATQTLVAADDSTEDAPPLDALPEGPAAEDSLTPEARKDFAEKLQQLEAFMEKAKASGEDIPPEAHEIVAHLHEIIDALAGLTKELVG